MWPFCWKNLTTRAWHLRFCFSPLLFAAKCPKHENECPHVRKPEFKHDGFYPKSDLKQNTSVWMWPESCLTPPLLYSWLTAPSSFKILNNPWRAIKHSPLLCCLGGETVGRKQKKSSGSDDTISAPFWPDGHLAEKRSLSCPTVMVRTNTFSLPTRHFLTLGQVPFASHWRRRWPAA